MIIIGGLFHFTPTRQGRLPQFYVFVAVVIYQVINVFQSTTLAHAKTTSLPGFLWPRFVAFRLNAGLRSRKVTYDGVRFAAQPKYRLPRSLFIVIMISMMVVGMGIDLNANGVNFLPW